MNYIKQINLLRYIIEVAIINGYVFNYKYDKTRMLNWLKAKNSSILRISKSPDNYILNKYYYSIIFDKKFLDAIVFTICENNLIGNLDSKLELHLSGKVLELDSIYIMVKNTLIEHLHEKENPLEVFANIFSHR